MRPSLLLLQTAVAIVAVTAPALAQSQDRPNIVYILVDNLGSGELGTYGGGILRGAPTPAIDQLAEDGFKLLNFGSPALLVGRTEAGLGLRATAGAG